VIQPTAPRAQELSTVLTAVPQPTASAAQPISLSTLLTVGEGSVRSSRSRPANVLTTGDGMDAALPPVMKGR